MIVMTTAKGVANFNLQVLPTLTVMMFVIRYNKPAPSSLCSPSRRMFVTFPGTKTYFSHLDISERSPHLLSHGKKIVLAIAEGARDISHLTVTLGPLQTLHAYKLRIDPSNFKLFSHCLLVTLACHMGEEFTPVAHAAIDKYLSAFSAVLAEKYR
ncbi:hemoglobin subunit alpha-D-like isoform X1 [Scomber japonicus]|uniref:hemoglobin subunit alpha-D-like isoform X1 n=1 Tax=Scomber japonicus TaxID=13676 RepID=UPI00230524CB|nr:hemoglobin subunit alpha-D-like isoform X1 [Scomber japonicus]